MVHKCEVFAKKVLGSERGKISGQFVVHITRDFVIFTAQGMVGIVKSVSL
jgi:hypothetical protein